MSLCCYASLYFSSLICAFDFLLFAVSFIKCAETPLETMRKKVRKTWKRTYHWCSLNFWKFHTAPDPSWHSCCDFPRASMFSHSSSCPPKFWSHFHRLWKSHLRYSSCGDIRFQLFPLESNRRPLETILPIPAFSRCSKIQRMVRVCVELLCFSGFSSIRPKCLSWSSSSWPCNRQGKFRPQQIGTGKFLSCLTSYFTARQKSE